MTKKTTLNRGEGSTVSFGGDPQLNSVTDVTPEE